MAAKFADFAELEAEVREYLGSLDETSLHDPAAPSPLAYLELQAAGRPDIAEGCMKHGGYLAVSERLGVRVQRRAAPPPSGPAPVFGGADVAEGGGVVLSAAAKEDKMAADLQRLARGGGGASSQQLGSASQPARVGDRLEPLPMGGPSTGRAVDEGAKASGMSSDFGRYVRFDGLQRAETLLVAALLAGGFGKTTAQLLDAPTTQAVQLAALVVLAAHVVIAGYGALVAAQAPAGRENPLLWFVKLTLTGAAGLAELRGRCAADSADSEAA